MSLVKEAMDKLGDSTQRLLKSLRGLDKDKLLKIRERAQNMAPGPMIKETSRWSKSPFSGKNYRPSGLGRVTSYSDSNKFMGSTAAARGKWLSEAVDAELSRRGKPLARFRKADFTSKMPKGPRLSEEVARAKQGLVGGIMTPKMKQQVHTQWAALNLARRAGDRTSKIQALKRFGQTIKARKALGYSVNPETVASKILRR